MKGLLLKDLYCLGQNVKSLLFIIVIWGLVFLPQKDGGLLLISLSMMVSAMFTFTVAHALTALWAFGIIVAR